MDVNIKVEVCVCGHARFQHRTEVLTSCLCCRECAEFRLVVEPSPQEVQAEITTLIDEREDICKQEDIVAVDIRAIKQQLSLANGTHVYNKLAMASAPRQQANRAAMDAMVDRKRQIKARLAELRPGYLFERAFLEAARDLLPAETYQQIIAAANRK